MFRTPEPRLSRLNRTVASLMTGSFLLLGIAMNADAQPVIAGFRDLSYGSDVLQKPTGSKPESKLWWNDGSWWGSLWNDAVGRYEIYEFDLDTQTWSSTGVAIDARGDSLADVLWDGSKLYVASHVFADRGDESDDGARLYRYSYFPGPGTYGLDPGFPVLVNSSESETLVLDKDSTGQLWITWIEDERVKVNRTLGNDLTWGVPFDLPVQGNRTDKDDVCSVARFASDRIGIMWSNQDDMVTYFAAHLDGQDDLLWEPREIAYSGSKSTDDHLNLKMQCDLSGSLYCVAKTGEETNENPLVHLLKRDPFGTWTSYPVAQEMYQHTRPILVIDSNANMAHVFATSSVTGRNVIFQKSSDLSNPYFVPGLGTPFIESAVDSTVNNVTTTKQCVTQTSGLLILASDHKTRRYLHNFVDLGSARPRIASFTPTRGEYGAEVTIDGANLSGVTAVHFNGSPASFVVDGETRIRALVPDGATSGRITVTRAGLGTGWSAQGFSVRAEPVIASFTPARGGALAEVTIHGEMFTGVVSVTFNGIPADTFSVDSDSQVRAIVPVGGTPGPIALTSPLGTGFGPTDFFVIPPPAITSFSPASASWLDEVQLIGSGFLETWNVAFDSLSADSFVIASDSVLTMRVPVGAKTGPIVVTGAGGVDTSLTSFVVLDRPVLTGVSPSAAIVGAEVMLEGWKFESTIHVTFGGTLASFQIESDQVIRAFVPPGSVTGPIAVENPWGTVVSPDTFTVIVPPVITSYSPTHGPVGSQVTIEGSGLAGTNEVVFGGVIAPSFTVDSNARVRVTVPREADLSRIRLTNAAGVDETDLFLVTIPRELTLVPTEDGYVRKDHRDRNYGSETTMRVRYRDPACVAYLKFDAFGVGGLVTGATLRLFADDGSSDGGRVYPVSNDFEGTSTPWTEVELTYENAPPIDGDAIAEAGRVNDAEWIELDVASAITSPGEYSFALKSRASSSTYYSSEEGGNPPELRIAIDPPPAIASFVPTIAPRGATVTIIGAEFVNATSVAFNGIPAEVYSIDSETQITAIVPPGATTGRITIEDASGSGSSRTDFEVILPPAPVSLSPPYALVGDTIRILGSTLTGVTSVQFNGVAALDFSVVHDTEIEVRVPVGAKTGPVVVLGPGGSGMSPEPFAVVQPPVVSSFTPERAPVGSPVQIEGTGFTGTHEVRFGEQVDPTFTVVSDSVITTVVPTAARDGAIIVTNAAASDASPTVFFVIDPPVIEAITPSSGPAGMPVSIVGRSLTFVTEVSFGEVPSAFQVESDTLIVATVPNGAHSGAIAVTNEAAGAESATEFVVIVPPMIRSLVPADGPLGASIRVVGSGFTGSATLSFGGISSPFRVDSDSVISTSVPQEAITGRVIVENAAASGSSAADFIVTVPPEIISFLPAVGASGASIRIVGSGFPAVSAVTFGGVGSAFTVESDSVITVEVPEGANTGPIEVLNSAGSASTTTDFTLIVPADVAGFSPKRGPQGWKVRIRGSEFWAVTRVTFSGVAATFTVQSDSLIETRVPEEATPGPIVVTNEAGQTSSVTDFFVILPPSIASFSPRRGPEGWKVKIQGSELSVATEVRFDGIAAPFSVVSDGLIEARVPTGAKTGPVVVKNAGGSTSAPSDFLVIHPPVIASFTPASAQVGAQVRLLGSGFTALREVTVSAVPASFTVEADSIVQVEVPVGATTGPIAVMNTAAVDTTENDLIVILPPAISSFVPSSGSVGTPVEVLGEGFTGVTEVTFGGTAAASFSVESDGLIRTVVPIEARTGPITVVNVADTAGSERDFVAIVPPVVSSFTPTSGPVNTEVIILGSGLTATTRIEFGGTPVSFIAIDSDSRIRARVPPGAAPGPIRVTNAAGTTESTERFTRITRMTVYPLEDASVRSSSPATNFGQEATLKCQTGSSATWLSFLKFRVSCSGTVESARLRLFVTDGSDDGGSVVSTSNDHFGGSVPWTEQELKFSNAPRITGDVLDTAGAVTRDTWIELDVSPALTGEGTYSFGLESASPNRVGYSSTEGAHPPELVIETTGSGPILVSFDPASGLPGTSVTLTGMNLTGVSTVSFGPTPVPFAILSDSVIVAEAPARVETGPIIVAGTLGSSSSTSDFLVVRVPLIAAFTPADGSAGDEVTIEGVGLLGLTAVEFHGIPAASFAVDSDLEVRAVVPNGATTGSIRVTNAAGSFGSAGDFVVTPPPFVATFPAIEDAYVCSSDPTLSYGQLATMRVRPGGPTCNAYVKADIRDLPGSIRRATLRLFSPNGGSDGGVIHLVSNHYRDTTTPWSEDGLTFLSAPRVEGESLDTVGPVRASTWAEFDVTDAITAEGTYSFALSATTNSIRYSSSEGDFPPEIVLEVRPLPAISSLSPSTAPFGSEVLIRGSGLSHATRVEFADTDASEFTVDADSEIRAIVPAGASVGRIRVTTPFGFVESDEDFTPTADPVVVVLHPSHDAQVRSSAPTRNYGTLETLRIRDGDPTLHTYLKFEVTGVVGQVTSAKLRLRATDGSDDGGEVHLVANNYRGSPTLWAQSGLAWENAPDIGDSPLDTLDRVSEDTWVEYDVTAAITGNGMISFAIRSGSDNSAYFSSLEGTHRPELVVESVPGAETYGTGRTGTPPEGRRTHPNELRLAQSRPNPSPGDAVISFALPRSTRVELAVFNVLGQRIRTLVDESRAAGFHEIYWNGRDESGRQVASATYFYVLRAGGYRMHRKLVIQR